MGSSRGTNDRQIVELHEGVLRILLREVVGQSLRSRTVRKFRSTHSESQSASDMRLEYAGLDLAMPLNLHEQTVVARLGKAVGK